MNLDPEICYRALRTRDARFDGRFFTGVRSTGVYCRPVCPARTPRKENCSFFPCAAAAREAGFRPCLRCRPEASPGTPAWLGTSTTVTRALRLISEGGLDHGRVDDLAARLGVGDRHLRRLFLEHLGATPTAVAQTRRVLFAKKLIDETDLSMGEIAHSAGFSSVRRFNAVLRETYGRAPRELRRGRNPDGSGTGSEITLRLPFRPPFDWASVAAFLAPRATPGVEEASPDFYRRTVRIDGVRGVIAVRPVEGESWLAVRIALSGPALLIDVAERARMIFDLGADPEPIASHLRRDRRIARVLRKVPGVRVPGAWDGFELAVRAILGQQVSVRGATTLAGRIVAKYGDPLDVDGSSLRSRLGTDGLHLLFPGPERLAAADLTTSGLPRARARAISTLASSVASGEIRLDGTGDPDATMAQLTDLPGVGEWTAQYIAMRALREPDAFPATDLGLRRALGNGKGPAPGGRVREQAEAWRPWRAYAAMALWMAASKGHEKGGSRGASRR
jgi:AraC family transcriptional regulator of adaptative response / DNA-3-methyladenine glycosylase II